MKRALKRETKHEVFEKGFKNSTKRPSVNYVGGRGGGVNKCLCYFISLCSKLAYGGGRGVKNWQNLAYVVYGWSLGGLGGQYFPCS